MPKERLTDKRLAALKPAPAGKRDEIMDAIMPGMGIRVTDKGVKTFFYVARYPGSTNPTRRALGEYGALTLEAAREKAREWHGLLQKGIDPKAEANDVKQANQRAALEKRDRSFEKVLERWIKARRRDGIRKVDEDERDFNRECVPAWKGKAIEDIGMADILKVVEGIAERGKQRQALNIAQKIGTFLNWCADDELIPSSPYRPKRIAIAVGDKQSRDRKFSDDEIRAAWKGMAGLGKVEGDVYRLLLLTGQRLNDIAALQWSEIDLDRKTITIPKERFKSDRDHVVPLTDDALAILNGATRWKDCSWVFSLNGEQKVTIGDKVKRRLDGLMLAAFREVTGDEEATLSPWVNHDLRRTVRTRLSELDVLDEVAEAVIGHMPTKLNRIYNHSERLRVKLDALNRWQGELRRLTGQEAPVNVVQLARPA